MTLLDLSDRERGPEVGSWPMAHALVTCAYIMRPINTQKEGFGQLLGW